MNAIKTIHGKFEVKSTPIDADPVTKDLGILRMRFDKIFEGPLTAKGTVSMMGLLNKDTGSGAYVALEKITGKLESKQGTFFFQHNSSMNNGKGAQSITVVPNSGTEDLADLTGEMIIEVKDGQHFYTFKYKL